MCHRNVSSNTANHLRCLVICSAKHFLRGGPVLCLITYFGVRLCVACALTLPLSWAPLSTIADEYEWAIQLIANPSHVHPHLPHPKAHHSALSHSVTHDNQRRDYGDQINYGLIHNAVVLTTVNPGLPKDWRQLITLISLVLAVEASMPTSPAAVSAERRWIVLH